VSGVSASGHDGGSSGRAGNAARASRPPLPHAEESQQRFGVQIGADDDRVDVVARARGASDAGDRSSARERLRRRRRVGHGARRLGLLERQADSGQLGLARVETTATTSWRRAVTWRA
jgi:hypothetical protein